MHVAERRADVIATNGIWKQWRIQGGRGAMPTPRWRPEIFFRQYINIITEPTAYDGPWEY